MTSLTVPRWLPAAFAAATIISATADAEPQKQAHETWLTIETSKIAKVKPLLSFAGELPAKRLNSVFTSDHGISVVALSPMQIHELATATHMLPTPSCPGFMAHDSYAEAEQAARQHPDDIAPAVNVAYLPTSTQTAAKITELMAAVEMAPVVKMNKDLEAMGSRHVSIAKDSEVAKLIAKQWQEDIGPGRDDVSVDVEAGRSNGQNSIIMTIKGTEKPDEIVVLGGHLDSTSRPVRNAPGADDNAAGMASISGVIAAIGKTGMKFKRTVQFMGYAAEEVGLQGSKVIAKAYKREGKKVVGVMQLDMTGYNPKAPPSIITDHTDKKLNGLVERLAGQFESEIGLGKFSKSRCGYGCSDHASWTAQGFAAAHVFETDQGKHNQKLHTPQDTRSRISDEKMTGFARFAAAFVVKLSEDSVVRP